MWPSTGLVLHGRCRVARKALVRKGMTIVDPPKAMVDDLTAAAAEVQNDMIGKLYSKEELAKVIAYRDEYRANHPAPAAKK